MDTAIWLFIMVAVLLFIAGSVYSGRSCCRVCARARSMEVGAMAWCLATCIMQTLKLIYGKIGSGFMVIHPGTSIKKQQSAVCER